MMSVELMDSRQATAVVNDAGVQRFLPRPCEVSILESAIELGLAVFQAAAAEHELMHQTLDAATEVLGNLLGLANPVSRTALWKCGAA